jgi:hypothetical protein
MAAARGEVFFEENLEAALLLLQGYAASLEKHEPNSVTAGALAD